MVFKPIFFQYFPFKNHSITLAIKGFLKKNYWKNLSLKIPYIITVIYLESKKLSNFFIERASRMRGSLFYLELRSVIGKKTGDEISFELVG